MKRLSLPLLAALLATTTGCFQGIGVAEIPEPPEEAEADPTVSELTVTPPVAGAGDVVTISFLVDQELASSTTVTVDGRAATLDGAPDAPIPGPIVVFTYEVIGDEQEGDVTVEVTAQNAFARSRSLSTSLQLDFTAPTVEVPVTSSDVEGFVPAAFSVTGGMSDAGSGIEACLVCSLVAQSEADIPSAESCQWRPGAAFGDTCTATGLTCLDEQLVALRLRAADAVGNTSDSEPVLVRCDTAPPTAEAVSVTPSSSLYLGPNFAVETQFADASSIDACEVCAAPDGTCDDGDWRGADLVGGLCTATVEEACADGDGVLVNMRARDALNAAWGTAAGQLRTCDGNSLVLSELDITGGAAVVGLEFTTTVVVIDDLNGAPPATCEVCATAAATCAPTDFVDGILQGDACRAELTCADGDMLTLQMRVTDAAGNAALSNATTRTCDADVEGAGVGVPTTPGTISDTHVGTAFEVSATVDADAATCETCVSLTGACAETDWQVTGTPMGGACTADLTCVDGERLTLGVRARDQVGNPGPAETISRTCDGAGPVAGVVSASNRVDDGYASSTFQLSASFVDGSAGIGGCESCAATDGVCDTEWSSDGATFADGTCAATVTCTSGDEVTIGLRATDQVGNASVTGPVANLICDGDGPAVANLAVSGSEAVAGVISPPFSVTAIVDDGANSAGPDGCEICVSTDGTCDTEWQGGTLAGTTCSAPSLSCVDGQTLTMSVRAVDGVGNVSDLGALPTVTRVCDSSGPLVGGLTIDGGGTSFTHVNQAGFNVQMVADDAISTSIICEVCVSGDGLCDDDVLEWQPATPVDDGDPMTNTVVCTAQGLTCPSSGDTYTVAMRAVDEAGFITTSAPATRICDGLPPQTAGPMTLVSGAEIDGGGQTYVAAGGYRLAARFTESPFEAGVVACDVCVGASCPAGAPFDDDPWSEGVFSPAANTCTFATERVCADGASFTVAMRGQDGTGQVSAPTTLDVVCDGNVPSVAIDTTLSQVGVGFPNVTPTHTGRLFTLEATFDDPGVDPSGLVSCDSCVTTDGSCDTESDWTGALFDDGTGLCRVNTVACVDGQQLTIAMRATDLLGNVTVSTELNRTCDDSAPLSGAVLTVAGANVTHVRGAGAGFNIEATFTDLISSVSGCERCVSVDGVCDGEWVAASFDSGTGLCSAAGLTCADLDDLVLQMRASDIVGNEAITTPIARSCDAQAPSAPEVSADNPDPYEIVLDWADVVELGAGLDTYSIDYDVDQPGAPYSDVSTTPFAGYTLGELAEVLPPCTSHYIRVRATDRVGNESVGNEVQMRTRCGGTGQFVAGPTLGLYPTTDANTFVEDLVAGDVNGDGHVDLIAPIRDNGSAGLDPDITQVLLGNGDGTFAFAPNATITGMSPNGTLTVDLADLDGDGDLDMLHLDSTDNLIRVLIGDGTGGFTHNPALNRGTTGNLSRDIQAADMNRDGVPDYVVASRNAFVDVRYQHGAGGRGSGAFDTAHNFQIPGGGEIFAARVADFDGDDIPDIVASSREQYRVFLYLQGGTDGRGNGSFSVSDDVAISDFWELAVGDFNGDGVPDVVSAGGDVLVSAGTDNGPPGNGTFDIAGIYPVSGRGGIAVGDLNRDGIDDIVMANDTLYVMMGQGSDGRGDGTFTIDTVNVGSNASHPVIADFNSDGLPDIAVVTTGGILQVMLGVGASIVATGDLAAAAPSIAAESGARVSAIGDLNGDRILDVAYTLKNQNGTPPMYILLGVGTNAQGHGSYVPFGSFNTGRFSWQAAAADIDEDGAVDLIVGNRSPGSGINLGDVVFGWNDMIGGRPSTTFEREAAPIAGNRANRGIALADFNDDGALDIAFGNQDAVIAVALNDALDGRGRRLWQPHADYALGGSPEYLVVGDFNSDGLDDIAASVDMGAGAVDRVEIILGASDGTGPAGGRSDGTFGAAQVAASGIDTALAIDVGDFNGDRITDIAVGGGSTVDILLGGGSNGYGDATFSAGPAFPAVSIVVDLDVVDINRDGIDDIIITDVGASSVRVFLGGGAAGVGDATFTLHDAASSSNRNGDAHLADMDGDGAIDVVVGQFAPDIMRVHPAEGTLTTVSP
jgi:hypothetical protein